MGTHLSMFDMEVTITFSHMETPSYTGIFYFLGLVGNILDTSDMKGVVLGWKTFTPKLAYTSLAHPSFIYHSLYMCLMHIKRL